MFYRSKQHLAVYCKNRNKSLASLVINRIPISQVLFYLLWVEDEIDPCKVSLLIPKQVNEKYLRQTRSTSFWEPYSVSIIFFDLWGGYLLEWFFSIKWDTIRYQIHEHKNLLFHLFKIKFKVKKSSEKTSIILWSCIHYFN